jgi:hypothetical protein
VDGFAVIMSETAPSPAASDVVETLRSPLIAEAYGQQLGEDLMVKVVLSDIGQADGRDLRSRQAYDAPRDLYVFSVDLVSAQGEAGAVERALAALGSLTTADVSGCALVFDDSLRRGLGRGVLDRALAPRGAFTDRYLRAAMRRLGEISVDGVVDFSDGQQFRPARPIELEMSISSAPGANGYLALLSAFAVAVEATPDAGREGLRGLIAPDLPRAAFDRIVDAAQQARDTCAGSAGVRARRGDQG